MPKSRTASSAPSTSASPTLNLGNTVHSHKSKSRGDTPAPTPLFRGVGVREDLGEATCFHVDVADALAKIVFPGEIAEIAAYSQNAPALIIVSIPAPESSLLYNHWQGDQLAYSFLESCDRDVLNNVVKQYLVDHFGGTFNDR
ncbi:MAG: hypothetical protein KJZ79_16720 [Bryobacteraceae bacterium]|nr:hypothetical protein [Bryobacteraceae bacterium]